MSNTVKNRSEIDEKYTWNLGDIFESDKAWEAEFERVKSSLPQVEKFKGRLGESSAVLKEAMDFYENSYMDMMELYAYARMNKDLDNKESKYQAMFDQVVSVYFGMSAMTSFVEPEISAIDEDVLRTWIREDGNLSDYAHFLDDLIRNKKHILSADQERLLSGMGPVIEGIGEAFTMLNNVELDFGEVTMEDGSKVKLTHGSYASLRENKDRNVRSQTFEKMHTAYKNFSNTIGAIYSSSVKSDVFMARTREFDSCMSRAMFADNLPESIYTNLIEAIHDSLPSYYKYMNLRKRVLDLDELHIYDTAIPIVGELDKTYDFELAKELLLDGLKPLGETYMKDLENFIEGRAIDVYETPGKTSGAYAWSTYKTHPYMLLNWSSKLDDVFTFAHEAGHCMHTFYSAKNQTFMNSSYPIFLAEIASTVNENVLLTNMLDRCDTSTKEGLTEKAFLLNHYLDGVKGTVLRQTMFAEFELIIHTMAEEGKPLTSAAMCEVYEGLLKLYFGPDTVIDDYMTWEWARIPHFYNAFYVYKYATGFCAAALISKQLFEDEGAADRYNKFLSSGGSQYPADILNIMGIDLSEPEAVAATMELFDQRVDELSAIIDQLS